VTTTSPTPNARAHLNSLIILVIILPPTFGAARTSAMDVALITQNEKIDGNLEVTGDYNLNGLVTGNVVVRRGGSLQLNGTCAGTPSLLKKRRARDHSRHCSRNVVNHGMVDHFGIIQGDVTSDCTFERRPRSVMGRDVRTLIGA
jgi:hypothetical protein